MPVYSVVDFGVCFENWVRIYSAIIPATNRGYKDRRGREEVDKHSASSYQHFKLDASFSNEETDLEDEDSFIYI